MNPTADKAPGAANAGGYRGRLAPSPTGYLHLGHVRTFDLARRRAEEKGGVLILRNDDLDSSRCKPAFVEAMYDDLHWLGFAWSEGPDVGGNYGPYDQSRRFRLYREAWYQLLRDGWAYPCRCSRKDVLQNLGAPHEGEDEPVYPGTCRPESPEFVDRPDAVQGVCWRFRVPEGESVEFVDNHLGRRAFVAGRDFGDFVIWRRDGLPSYHLAAVVDDAAMRITEVVRGADLLLSTARQLLLFRALGLAAPGFYHCSLVRDEQGNRLAKRNGGMGLRALREKRYEAAAILSLAREESG